VALIVLQKGCWPGVELGMQLLITTIIIWLATELSVHLSYQSYLQELLPIESLDQLLPSATPALPNLLLLELHRLNLLNFPPSLASNLLRLTLLDLSYNDFLAFRLQCHKSRHFKT